MKLKFDYEIMNIADELTAVPINDNDNAFHGVLNINETGAFILNLLKEDTTVDTVVDKILSEYDGDKEQIRNYVEKFVAGLRENGLISEEN